MNSNISVLEIRRDVLSPRALALLSEFALILYRLNGTVIEVSSRNALRQVFNNAEKVSEPRLREICVALRAELISKYSAKTINKPGQARSNVRNFQ